MMNGVERLVSFMFETNPDPRLSIAVVMRSKACF